MKKLFALVLLFISAFMLITSGCSTKGSVQETTESNQAQLNEESNNDISTLIVYYSYTGTTKRVAEHLKNLTSGDLYEITLKEPHNGSDNDVSDRVFSERDNNQMPELSGNLPDINKYDRILIGTPVWNDSISNPIMSYLEKQDFSGKTVAPFWTYITNQGETESDFSSLVKNADIADCLALKSANSINDDELDQMLKNWINTINKRK